MTVGPARLEPEAPASRAVQLNSDMPVVGEALLHPLSLGALCLWAANDHLWKAAYGNWLTGKLSDVCSLIVFPLLLFCAPQLLWRLRRKCAPPHWSLIFVVVLVGVAFSGINTTPAIEAMYRFGVAFAHAPLVTLQQPALLMNSVDHTLDVADLLTLPALWFAYRLGRPYVS
ncbi:MAG: hypothetical protein RJA70_3545 [Pseudomonadota bacterium]